jgi:predicted oxidoreductase
MEQVGLAIRAGRIAVITTHVQADEHGRVKWPAKREALLALPLEFVEVVTSGGVWDTSKWDKAAWSDKSGERIKRLTGGNPKHIEDALIAATADAKAHVLVTDDRRLAKKAYRAGFTVLVWDVAKFAAWLAAGGGDYP